jgi:hypothetical protein
MASAPQNARYSGLTAGSTLFFVHKPDESPQRDRESDQNQTSERERHAATAPLASSRFNFWMVRACVTKLGMFSRAAVASIDHWPAVIVDTSLDGMPADQAKNARIAALRSLARCT